MIIFNGRFAPHPAGIFNCSCVLCDESIILHVFSSHKDITEEDITDIGEPLSVALIDELVPDSSPDNPYNATVDVPPIVGTEVPLLTAATYNGSVFLHGFPLIFTEVVYVPRIM